MKTQNKKLCAGAVPMADASRIWKSVKPKLLRAEMKKGNEYAYTKYIYMNIFYMNIFWGGRGRNYRWAPSRKKRFKPDIGNPAGVCE